MLQVGERPTRNKGQRCFLKSRGREHLADGFTPRVQCEGPLRLVACGCIHENAPEEPARKGRTVPGRGRQGQALRGDRGGAGGGRGASRTEGCLGSCRHGQRRFILQKGALPYSPGESSCIRVMLPKWHFLFRKECFAQDEKQE